MRTDATRLRLTGGLTLTERVEADSGEPGDWSFLRRPALLGFVAVMSICLGASLPSSPFKLEMGGTWFFGEATWPTTVLMLPGVVAVYGGMVLFVRVWFGLYQTLRARPGVPIRQLGYMLGSVADAALGRGSALQPGRVLLRGPGRDDEPPHQPVPLRTGNPGLGAVRLGCRSPLDQHGRSLRPALPHAGRLVGLVEPPPRAGHRAAAAAPVGRRHCADRLLHSQACPLIRPRRRPRVRARRPQPVDPAGPGRRRPQRRHHGGPPPGRRDGGALPPPGVGHRAVRARGLHQGARGHGHRLRGVGLGRSVGELAPANAASFLRSGLITVSRDGCALVGFRPRLGVDRQPRARRAPSAPGWLPPPAWAFSSADRPTWSASVSVWEGFSRSRGPSA